MIVVVVVEVGILVLKGAHFRNIVIRISNSAVLIIPSVFVLYPAILQKELTHSELTITPDAYEFARGIIIIVPVSDADVAIRVEVDASAVALAVLVVFTKRLTIKL